MLRKPCGCIAKKQSWLTPLGAGSLAKPAAWMPDLAMLDRRPGVAPVGYAPPTSPAPAAPIQVTSNINLDGRQIAQVVTGHHQMIPCHSDRKFR